MLEKLFVGFWNLLHVLGGLLRCGENVGCGMERIAADVVCKMCALSILGCVGCIVLA